MKVRLADRPGTPDLAIFGVPPDAREAAHGATSLRLGYESNTGAVLRVDGHVRGAFDREHREITLPATELAGDVTLEVERRAMPSTGLPSGDGRVWRKILAGSAPDPATSLTLEPTSPEDERRAPASGAALPLVGHSHLDVAWLWRFEETRRKAVRTLATACRQLDDDPSFVFAFSQPQLYAWVAEDEPELFARVLAYVASGRIDASVAPMWIESDCNLPSGESLLRQLTLGCRFTREILGAEPSVAWLPDSFGFAATLPTLLAHAGIGAFGTTKLGWNDTNVFPLAQFRWEGPDGSAVVAAQIASIQGAFGASRIAEATKRGDPLLVGFGDGGGGVPDAALREAGSHGGWTSLGAWFAALETRAETLPVWRDELYLEEHRGTYTTHHDMKSRNAALERALEETELLGAWACALHASRFFLDEFRAQVRAAWEIVLRAQFHDILPGSAVGGVYDDVNDDYDAAGSLIAGAAANARAVLPRVRERARLLAEDERPPLAAPIASRGRYTFANERLRAIVLRDGTLAALHATGPDGRPGPNLVKRANRLAAYVDRPRAWEAWNLDRGYARRGRRVRFAEARIDEDALEIPLRIGDSVGVMRISLGSQDAFLRVELAVAWVERRTVLRVENDTRLARARLRFGAPHGSVERRLADRSAFERARYEVPGQRYARVDGGNGAALAILSLDGYGWSAHAGSGRARVGHSLLRGTSWPDPDADRGEQICVYGFAPLLATEGLGVLEERWRDFAGMTAVPMFTTDDPAVLVVATKPADDGDGIIVRVRECDGAPRPFSLRCGARARSVTCVDAHERPAAGEIALVDGALEGAIGAFALRSFRVGLA